jgi:serine/threonine protein kinase
MAESIYQKMCDITGPYREYTPIARNILYGSYHFEAFNKTEAWRNTLIRFDEFLLPQNLSGKIVYDLGSCLGALTFESIRRGASKAIGFEYNSPRVDLSNQLTKYLHIDDRLQFVQMDIDKISATDFLATYGYADIVFCCALDAYVNKEHLYQFISSITKDMCCFETNSSTSPEEFKNIMGPLGFELIVDLGSSQSDINPTRHIYLLQKKGQLISCKRSVKMVVDYEWIYTDNDIYRVNDHIVILYVPQIYENIKKIYEKIQDIKYVPRMIFRPPHIIMPVYTNQLSEYQATPEEKKIIKTQLVDFIQQLNHTGIAHRDLHIKNAFFHEGLLRIIDWEAACENICPLNDCYDLTGKGDIGYEYYLPDKTCPLKSTVFVLQDYICSFFNYLDGNLSLKDVVNE